MVSNYFTHICFSYKHHSIVANDNSCHWFIQSSSVFCMKFSYLALTLSIATLGMSIDGQMVYKLRDPSRSLLQNMLNISWTGLKLSLMMNPYSHRSLVNILYSLSKDFLSSSSSSSFYSVVP